MNHIKIDGRLPECVHEAKFDQLLCKLQRNVRKDAAVNKVFEYNFSFMLLLMIMAIISNTKLYIFSHENEHSYMALC